MKIGFDAKRAVQNYTGLGNYSRYIIKSLCLYCPQNEYILYTPKKKQNIQLNNLINEYQQIKVAYPIRGIWKKLSSLWRIWGVKTQLTQDHIQVFHGLSNELPLNMRRSDIKTVVTIHDLIFLRYPQYYKFIDRQIYTYKFRKACQNADKIIAISECTKRDIIKFFDIPEHKIEIVYQGCDEAFHAEATEEKKKAVREKYSLPERYILNVGSIEERKNVLLAAKAMEHIPLDVHLVIVGKYTHYTKSVERFIRKQNLESRIHIYHNIPFDDLPAIYQQAEIFVYPSRYEGFGIPIIEALHSNIPVIGAIGSCLEEAGGPQSAYVDPDRIGELAESIKTIISNPKKREEIVRIGKEYVKKFSTEKQIQQLIHIYKNMP